LVDEGGELGVGPPAAHWVGGRLAEGGKLSSHVRNAKDLARGMRFPKDLARRWLLPTDLGRVLGRRRGVEERDGVMGPRGRGEVGANFTGHGGATAVAVEPSPSVFFIRIAVGVH
jgi:hypothetical protein